MLIPFFGQELKGALETKTWKESLMKTYVPRWLYPGRQVVAAADFIEIDSAAFQNTSLWPFKLEFLSLVGYGDAVPVDADWGRPGHRMAITMGISGRGSLFPTPQSIPALFCNVRPPRLAFSEALSPGAGFEFKQEVALPPSTGIFAQFHNQDNNNNAWIKPTAAFKGIIKDFNTGNKTPVLLADRYKDVINPDASVLLRGSELTNDGREDVILKRMCLSSGEYWGGADSPNAVRYSSVAWRINPTNGVLWMPDPTPIPVGCVAPYNRSFRDTRANGPRAYKFADNVYLKPDQKLEIGLYNDDDEPQTVGICLFGYLEVQ